MIFFSFFQKTGFDISCKLSPLNCKLEKTGFDISYIVTIGDNMHKMSNLFSGKIRKYFKMRSAENFTKKGGNFCNFLFAFLHTKIIPVHQDHSCTPRSFLYTKIIPAYQDHSGTPRSFLHTKIILVHQDHSGILKSFLHTKIILAHQDHSCTPRSFLHTKIILAHQEHSDKSRSFLHTKIIPAHQDHSEKRSTLKGEIALKRNSFRLEWIYIFRR